MSNNFCVSTLVISVYIRPLPLTASPCYFLAELFLIDETEDNNGYTGPYRTTHKDFGLRDEAILEHIVSSVMKKNPDADYSIQHVLPSVVKQIVIQEGFNPTHAKENNYGLTGIMIMFMLCSMNLNYLGEASESEITPLLTILRKGKNREKWGDALYVVGACLVANEDNPVRTNTKSPPLSNILLP